MSILKTDEGTPSVAFRELRVDVAPSPHGTPRRAFPAEDGRLPTQLDAYRP